MLLIPKQLISTTAIRYSKISLETGANTDMTIKERVQQTKIESSPVLAASTEAQRNAALALIADRLYETAKPSLQQTEKTAHRQKRTALQLLY